MSNCLYPIKLKEQNFSVDCGRCINCIKKRKKEIAFRMMKEYDNYDYKYFITLTYDNENVPIKEGILVLKRKDLVNYIKRIRERLYRMYKKRIKLAYVACGEYGTKKGRPHYHISLLVDVPCERILKECWNFGKIDVQHAVSKATVLYTTAYTAKKEVYKNKYKWKEQKGERAFVGFSKGLGKEWILKHKDNFKIIENYIIRAGNYVMALPRYFKEILKKEQIVDESYIERLRAIARDIEKEKSLEKERRVRQFKKTLEGSTIYNNIYNYLDYLENDNIARSYKAHRMLEKIYDKKIRLKKEYEYKQQEQRRKRNNGDF